MSPAYAVDELVSLDPYSYKALQDMFSLLIIASPAFFLLQISALVLLLWQFVARGALDIPGVRTFVYWVILLGVAVVPNVMLAVSVVFVGVYQEQFGHWFYHINDGLAGLVLLPMYVAGSVIVGRGLTNRGFRLKSGLHFVVLLTLIAICLWYVFATAVLNMITDELIDLQFTAIVPAVAAASYTLLAFDIRRRGQLLPARKLDIIAWFSALAVTLAVKIPLAMRLFESLPVERPSGYGDCFVVSAAAMGHPRFVGSHYDQVAGRSVNGQLHTLRAFEDRLAKDCPIFHCHLRRLYNRTGPPIAAQIRSPFIADLMYLLLKPIEWLASMYLVVKPVRQEKM